MNLFSWVVSAGVDSNEYYVTSISVCYRTSLRLWPVVHTCELVIANSERAWDASESGFLCSIISRGGLSTNE